MSTINIPLNKPWVKLLPWTRNVITVEKGSNLCASVYNVGGKYMARLYINGSLYAEKEVEPKGRVGQICFPINLGAGSYNARLVVEYNGKKYTDERAIKVAGVSPRFQNLRIAIARLNADVEPGVYSVEPEKITVKERLGVSLSGLPRQVKDVEYSDIKICITDKKGFKKCFTYSPKGVYEWAREYPLRNNLDIAYTVKLYYKGKLMDEKTVSKNLTNIYKKILPAIKDVSLDIRDVTRQHVLYRLGVKLAFPPLVDLDVPIIVKPVGKNVSDILFKIKPRKGEDEYTHTSTAELRGPVNTVVLGYKVYYQLFDTNQYTVQKPLAKTPSESGAKASRSRKRSVVKRRTPTTTKPKMWPRQKPQLTRPRLETRYILVPTRHGLVKKKIYVRVL